MRTGGEWRAEYVEAGSIWVIKAGDKTIAFAYEKADAEFIAASPDVLSALREAFMVADGDTLDLKWTKNIINKAEGRL